MEFSCPNCNLKGTIPDDRVPEAGLTANCPKCKNKFTITKDGFNFFEPASIAPEAPSFSAPAQPSRRADEKFCHSCGKAVHGSAAVCPGCGASLAAPVAAVTVAQQATSQHLPSESQYCNGCGKVIHRTAASCPHCGFSHVSKVSGSKNRNTAMILAFVLGGIGAHKFYLGQTVQGVIYLLFCWTCIPALIAIVELIQYAMMKEEVFQAKYA